MINEAKLWTLLDQLQHWADYVDDNDNSNYNGLWDAITEVMADLDDDDSNTDVTGTMSMIAYWRPWHGGKQPVPDGTHVDVQFRGGDIKDGECADEWYWEHNDDQYDIVAYRVIGYKPEETKPIIPEGAPMTLQESIRAAEADRCFRPVGHTCVGYLIHECWPVMYPITKAVPPAVPFTAHEILGEWEVVTMAQIDKELEVLNERT